MNNQYHNFEEKPKRSDGVWKFEDNPQNLHDVQVCNILRF